MNTTLRSRLKSFVSARGGQASIVFGIAAVPLFVMMGMAVDLSKQVSNQKALQATMDSAALAAASAYAKKNDDTYKTVAQKFFEANAPVELAGNMPTVKAAVNTATLTLTAETTATFKNSIMGLIGNSTTTMTAKSKVVLPVFSDYHKGEIVLVLDYSGSMDDKLNGTKKYVAMRDETVKLVNALSQSGANDDVKFGLVPFSGEVYVKMPKKYWYDQGSSTTDRTSCTRDRKYPSNTTDATPDTSSTSATRWGQPLSASDPHGISCSVYATKKLQVRDLTLDHAGTVQAIKDALPVEWTNIAVGMEFGWHLLSPNAPFTSGVAYNTPDTLKAVVLLTDGEQTTYNWGSGGSISVANGQKNLETICTGMKAKGIRILTVSYDLPAGTNETRLRNCATSPDDFFDVNTQEQLANAFGVITNKLARSMYLSE